jgi:Flp pilus assembly protein TadD
MLKRQFAAGLLAAIASLSMPHIAAAVDLDTTPEANAENPDFTAGRKAIERKNWNEAVKRFSRVVDREPGNADAHNLLGYSLRWQGNVDAAIASYERALKLNPKHRGALEYSGIAFVKAGNMARAQDNLAKLKDICGVNCDEYKDLAKAIAEQSPAGK